MMEARVRPSPSAPGRFAVVRYAAGVETVECDGFTTAQRAAKYAAQVNEQYERDRADVAGRALKPEDRKIPSGFYASD